MAGNLTSDGLRKFEYDSQNRHSKTGVNDADEGAKAIWLPTDDGQAIPIAMFRGSRYYAIHSDHLGTPRLMTDDTAKPVWQWPYSAFGETKPTGILAATANPNAAMTAAPLLRATAPAAALNQRFAGLDCSKR